MPIVLDTNIVRDLGAGRLDRSQFDRLSNAHVSIHLSDTAASELVHALFDERLWWDHWTRAKQILVDLLDSREPILMGGGQGLARAGLVPRTAPSGSLSINEAAEAYTAGWHLLIGANSLDQLRDLQLISPGATAGYQFDSVSEVMAAEKSSWIDDFRDFDREILAAVPDLPTRIPARADSAEALQMFMTVLSQGIDDLCPAIVPRASIRLDAFLRVHALLRLRSLRRKDRYNPTKDANDAFDHPLLKYLAHPAAIWTHDRGLLADVEATGSWQRKWIVTAEDLPHYEVIAELTSMRWPE